MKTDQSSRYSRPLLAAVITFILSGCASYQPIPLTHSINLAPNIDQLTTPKTARINSVDGLNLTEVAKGS